MMALVAAGAFVGLFGMWVVLPRLLLRKQIHDNFAKGLRPDNRD